MAQTTRNCIIGRVGTAHPLPTLQTIIITKVAMTAKKLPPYLAKRSEISRLPTSSFLVRTLIYSSVLFGLVAAYDFAVSGLFVNISHRLLKPEPGLVAVNKYQQAYYAENQKFNDSPELFKNIGKTENKYNYKLVSSMGPVQSIHNESEPAQFESTIAIAEPKNTDDKSYIGVVFAFKEDTRESATTTAGICETVRGISLPSTLPSFNTHNQISCPAGTTLISR
ncbi:type IV pilin-like G/H family protein [Microcoleus sp.]|uniref:type IV pilin-like G/H family protein n=1 Tax=Microcoleus sp. TaxID=44472 RepID=UPI00403E9C12